MWRRRLPWLSTTKLCLAEGRRDVLLDRGACGEVRSEPEKRGMNPAQMRSAESTKVHPWGCGVFLRFEKSPNDSSAVIDSARLGCPE